VNGALYHRFGLRYSFARSLYAQLTLKTHFAKADYGEIGIGYLPPLEFKLTIYLNSKS
jgi:hypothetical protein